MFRATFAGQPCPSAKTAAEEITLLGKPIPSEFQYVNSLLNPAGRSPARGFVLMRRKDLDEIDRNALHTLWFEYKDQENQPQQPTRRITFYNLCVSKEPVNLTPAYQANDPDALYLVELSDARWRCFNPYYHVPIDRHYNCRLPYESAYFVESLNGGANWTWQEMVDDVWDTMSGQLGASASTTSGLPFTPDGTPEGWSFPGVPAWLALNWVLDRLGCMIVWNPTVEAKQYSIVQIGAADPANAKILRDADAANLKIHDAEYLPIVRGRTPYGVRVFFHRQETDGSPSTNWQPNSVYSVDVDGPDAANAEPNAYHVLWDDLPALYDAGGVLANSAALNARAQERADDYFRGDTKRTLRHYSGLLAVQPGSTVKAVSWHEGQGEIGCITQVIWHPFSLFEVTDTGRFQESRAALDDSTRVQSPYFRPGSPEIWNDGSRDVSYDSVVISIANSTINSTSNTWNVEGDNSTWVFGGNTYIWQFDGDNYVWNFDGNTYVWNFNAGPTWNFNTVKPTWNFNIDVDWNFNLSLWSFNYDLSKWNFDGGTWHFGLTTPVTWIWQPYAVYPSSPVDGQVWLFDCNFYYKCGGVEKYLFPIQRSDDLTILKMILKPPDVNEAPLQFKKGIVPAVPDDGDFVWEGKWLKLWDAGSSKWLYGFPIGDDDDIAFRKLITKPSEAGEAGFRLPIGDDPTTPDAGDGWSTSAQGLHYRDPSSNTTKLIVGVEKLSTPTANTVAKFADDHTLVDSSITDDGNDVTVGPADHLIIAAPELIGKNIQQPALANDEWSIWGGTGSTPANISFAARNASGTLYIGALELSETGNKIGGKFFKVDGSEADDFRVPYNGTFAPTVGGEIGVNNAIPDFSLGVLKFFGAEEQGVVSMPIAQFTSPTDGHVVAYNATNNEFELVDPSAGGSGITELNGQTGTTQTFSRVDDTNVTLVISSATDTHTFTLGWFGTLAISRGGTGGSTAQAGFDNLSPLTSTGDLLVRGPVNNVRLPKGSDGQVLTVDSAETNDLKWDWPMPAGMIAPYAGATIPGGWLECNGSAVSRTTYSRLFDAIGTTWGAGNGTSTFNVPDLRGRAAIGAGQGSGLTNRTLAATGGNETHTLAESEMPSHTHTPANSTYFITGNTGSWNNAGGTDGTAAGQTGATGGGGSHNNMQPFAVIKWMIKV